MEGLVNKLKHRDDPPKETEKEQLAPQLHSPIAQLQRRLGNSGLAQLRAARNNRAAVQRQPGEMSVGDAEGWVRSQVEAKRESAEGEEARLAEQVQEVSVPSGGEPLPGGLRAHAENQLGVGLGDVQVVHNGGSATQPLEAKAFAAHEGSTPKVVLDNEVDLNNRDGQFTLMHELAHVAQQKRGQADQLDGLGGDENLRESLEHDADSAAEKLIS